MSGLDVPVLVVAYNRPDLTSLMMHRIRAQAPRQLFVALDGPQPGEHDACAAVHRVATTVDWPCDLQVLRRTANLGCRLAVNGAIDWFFDHVEYGIIIEDDILVADSFFDFCAELLDRYRDDERVWMISGVNLAGAWPAGRSSYVFGHGGIWGWATWRRAWRRNDVEMCAWEDLASRNRAREFLGESEWRHLAPRFQAVHDGRVDTWDYQWSYARAAAGGLTVIPTKNLVRNLGFRADATHTRDSASPFASLRANETAIPLVHPSTVAFDRAFQRRVTRLEHPSTLVKVGRRVARAGHGGGR